MTHDSALREQLIRMLQGGLAHATFDDVIRDFPTDKIGIRPHGIPHSAWELLEHMRIAQNDILEFSRSAEYVSPNWPQGYWPKSAAPATPGLWNESVARFRQDLVEFEALLQDPKIDLNREFPWGDGQTVLREALLIGSHNSYHLGQLVQVRRLVGAWGK
ncbi:MAG TPA: DinB family protein [Bryobacteraceae bacterium]|nr:DinB family protein [Bryobacteraceae bacterium]